MPHNLPPETLSAHLQHTKAEALIAEAGSLDLFLVAKGNDRLSFVLWVAKDGSRHMDWHEKPENVKSGFEVAVWNELVEEHKDIAGLEVPEYEPATRAPAVSTVWPSSSQAGEFIEFQSEVKLDTCRIAMSLLTLSYRISCLLLPL